MDDAWEEEISHHVLADCVILTTASEKHLGKRILYPKDPVEVKSNPTRLNLISNNGRTKNSNGNLDALRFESQVRDKKSSIKKQTKLYETMNHLAP